MPVELHRYLHVREFLDRAEPRLLRCEVEHNLLLGVARQLRSGEHDFEKPVYLATVEVDGKVAGCAFRTPPFKLGLTRFPISAIPLLVQDLRQVYASIPAVLGPEEEATAFAELWTRQFGGHVQMGMRQAIHALEAVVLASPYAVGALRRAEPGDRPLIDEWMKGFVRETEIVAGNLPRRAEQFIREGALYLWENGEPRSMAAAAGTTPNGMRIGYVYTPPAFRGRGYATAVVASVSQRLLDDGHRYCFLYTDLANPTSNAIYRRIGYRKACEVIDINLVPSTPGGSL